MLGTGLYRLALGLLVADEAHNDVWQHSPKIRTATKPSHLRRAKVKAARKQNNRRKRTPH